MNATLNLNLPLRGSAMLVLVLVAATLWRDHPDRVATRVGAAFAPGVAAATLGSAPGFAGVALPWRAAIAAVAAGSMFVFRLFTRALLAIAQSAATWRKDLV